MRALRENISKFAPNEAPVLITGKPERARSSWLELSTRSGGIRPPPFAP